MMGDRAIKGTKHVLAILRRKGQRSALFLLAGPIPWVIESVRLGDRVCAACALLALFIGLSDPIPIAVDPVHPTKAGIAMTSFCVITGKFVWVDHKFVVLADQLGMLVCTTDFDTIWVPDNTECVFAEGQH